MTASSLAVGVTIAGCVILAVVMFLSDDKRKPVLSILSRHIMVFMVPFLIIFAYLVIIWGAKILSG
jgi:hypothetical protein